MMISLIIHYLRNFKDNEIVTECLWALAFYLENFEGGVNSKPKIIIDWGIFHFIVSYLDSDKSAIVRPLLRIIGHLSYGTAEEFNCILSNDLVNKLENLLKHETLMIRFDACWIISNVLIKNQEAYEKFYRSSLFYTLGEIIALDKRNEVVVEALSVFHSFINEATPAILNDLIRGVKVVSYIMEALQRNDDKVILNVLKCLDLLIISVESNFDTSQGNLAVHEIRYNENFMLFERLIGHSNRDIYDAMDRMVFDYFQTMNN